MAVINERAEPAQKSVADRVRALIADQVGTNVEDVWPSVTFRDDLGTDSLEMVEIEMAVEEEFEVEISANVSEAWRTVGDAIAWIERAVVARADR